MSEASAEQGPSARPLPAVLGVPGPDAAHAADEPLGGAGAAPRAAPAARVAPLGIVLLLALMAALALLTWRAWADVFVDFGRELYQPWRVTQGEVLYRDLAAFNGPLSVYWNAGWMALVGGYTGLIVSNLLLLALLVWLLARFLARLATPFAALAAVVLFLLVFAFGHTSGVGNYEFPSPYAHEATHGLLLALAALALLHAEGRGGRARLVGAGLLLGLVFLTKLELFLAAALALALGAWLRARSLGRSPRADLGLLALGACAPVALAVLLLATAMPLGAALAGLCEAWRGALGPTAQLSYYRGELGTGFDRPLANLAILGWTTAGFLGLVVLASLGERAAPRGGWRAALLAFLGLSWLLSLLPAVPFGTLAGRPLPALMLLFGCALCVRWRGALDPDERALLAARASFVAFALACLAKMLLAARLWHYGFVLALPAVLVCVLYGLAWLPAQWRARGSSGRIVQACFLALLARLAWVHGETSVASYRERTVPVAAGPDRLWADERGTYAQRALEAIEEHVPPDGTLLVLPEGVMLNYLARRPTPTRFVNFMPPELALWGERAMLAELEARPPDAVLLVHKRTSEYGLELFGRDYGVELFAWVRERYEPVWSHGDPPLAETSRMGVALLLPRRPGAVQR